MWDLGQYKELTIDSIEKHGVYLCEPGNEGKRNHILLPGVECDGNEKIGDVLEVFLYLDSKDRPVATKQHPKLCVGEVAPLYIKEITKIGAFLDMGLPRDVLLPYREMLGKPKAGQTVLARLYIDKTNRLCASMKGIYHLLRTDSPYSIGEEVEGRIYEFGHDFGTFVAVADVYSAMIPRHERLDDAVIGDIVRARITGIKPDGKIDLSTRLPAYQQISDDAQRLLDCLDSYAGVLPFTEKAEASIIKRETGLSKAAFKRAVGHLYKQRCIEITDEGKIRTLS